MVSAEQPEASLRNQTLILSIKTLRLGDSLDRIKTLLRLVILLVQPLALPFKATLSRALDRALRLLRMAIRLQVQILGLPRRRPPSSKTLMTQSDNIRSTSVERIVPFLNESYNCSRATVCLVQVLQPLFWAVSSVIPMQLTILTSKISRNIILGIRRIAFCFSGSRESTVITLLRQRQTIKSYFGSVPGLRYMLAQYRGHNDSAGKLPAQLTRSEHHFND